VNRGLYHHCGIYEGEGYVIHFAAKKGHEISSENAVIQRTTFEHFKNGCPVKVIDLVGGFPPNETLRRARSRLGEKGYDLATNNCDHFAVWCKTGEHRSIQVDGVKATLGAIDFGEIGSPIVKMIFAAHEIAEAIKAPDTGVKPKSPRQFISHEIADYQIIKEKSKMENVSELRKIAGELELANMEKSLAMVEERLARTDTELVVPLVGEFSAGKTSLLNALMTARLETAAKPTTSVVFEIRFGNAEQRALLIRRNGDTEEVADIDSLKNDELRDVVCVQVFDTSTKIPSTTVLVDTPGLSSLEPAHQKALADYLPFADMVLLVIDVEQGDINASTLRFIKLAELAKKRICVVLAKCDTKSEADAQNVKQNIINTMNLSTRQIACVSAKEGKLDELHALIAEIQKDRNKIIEESVALRVSNLKAEMLSSVNDLIESSKLSTADLDTKIVETKKDIAKFHQKIEQFLLDLECRIDRICEKTQTDFSRRIFQDMESFMANASGNTEEVKQSVMAQVRNAAAILFTNFEKDIVAEIKNLARESLQNGGDHARFILMAVDSMNFDMGDRDPFSLQLDLDPVNSEDKKGIIVEGVKKLLQIGKMIPVPKVWIVVNAIEKVLVETNALDEIVAIVFGGAVKPQRKRIIEDYIERTLKPQFEAELRGIGASAAGFVRNRLNSQAEGTLGDRTAALEKMREEKDAVRVEFRQKMDSLVVYKQRLES